MIQIFWEWQFQSEFRWGFTLNLTFGVRVFVEVLSRTRVQEARMLTVGRAHYTRLPHSSVHPIYRAHRLAKHAPA